MRDVGILADLRTIDRIAGVAATRSLSRTLPLPERHDAARGAIVVMLAEAARSDSTCTISDLIQAGTRAIDEQTRQWARDHGQSTPWAWATYWLDRQHARVPDAEVPPKIALREVFSALPDRHQEALLTLAAHGNPQAAAAHLGVQYTAMQKRIQTARIEFYRLWWDWEQAPKPPFDRRSSRPLPTHCGRGHEYTPENTRWRRATNGRGQKRACRACDRRPTTKDGDRS